MDEGIGFSYFVSVGNMLDVSMGDLIDYFGSATETRSIILYIESISEAREFMSAARAFARTKPIVAYKAGRFAESAQAAASHTGAMAGVDAVYEAAFQRAGIERIFQIEDMFDCAELLARQQPPKGDRLAIITNAGGPGVMTTDALIDRDGELAEDLATRRWHKLNEFLPTCWSHGNPIDVLGDAPPDRFAKAVEIVLKDKNVDAVLVILTPQAMTDPTATAEAVGKAAGHAHKPVLAAWMGGRVVAEGIQLLNDAGIPTYNTPEKAVRAFMHLVSYARNLQILHETPRDIPLEFTLDRAAAARRVRHDPDRRRRHPLRERLEGVLGGLRDSGDQAAGRPHGRRGGRGGPAARLSGGAEDPLAADHPQDRRRRRGAEPGHRRQGPRGLRARSPRGPKRSGPTPKSSASPCRRWSPIPNSFELIMGTKKDPVFGSVIMVGMGGVAAEVFRDRALGLPPLNEALARRMLESLKSWPLLQGYRGKPGANIDRLIEIIMRFSYLVADYPEIKELDINPLLVTPEDVDRLGRPRGDRPRPGGPHGPALRPPGDPAVSRGVRHRAEDEGRHAGHPAADQARRRADVARAAGGAARRSRSGSASATCSSRPRTRWPPATASSTTTASWASWPRWRRKGSGS